MNLTQIANGDWVKVRGVNFGSAGAKTYSASVASTAAGGSIELHLDSPTGTLIGTCAVPATGGAQVWMNTTCDVSAASGVKDLVLKFVGGSFNVDYWQFTGGDGGTGGTGGNGSAGNDGVGGVPGSGGAGNSGSAGLSSAGSITGGQATGGSLGTAGGTSSSGGSAGKAGTGNPAGGSRSSAGSAAPTDPASCSCGVVGSKSSSGHWLALALGLAFSFRKRPSRGSSSPVCR